MLFSFFSFFSLAALLLAGVDLRFLARDGRILYFGERYAGANSPASGNGVVQRDIIFGTFHELLNEAALVLLDVADRAGRICGER